MALITRVTRFLSNPFRIFLPWRALRPLREIQRLFLGSIVGRLGAVNCLKTSPCPVAYLFRLAVGIGSFCERKSRILRRIAGVS